jgi:hypothetical protein
MVGRPNYPFLMSQERPNHGRGQLLLSLSILGLISLPFACRRAPEVVIKEVEVPTEKIVERIVEKKVIEKPPLPSRSVAHSSTPDDIADLYNGILLKTEMELTEGSIASLERKKQDAYEAAFSLKLRVPKPNQTLDELATNNEHLPKILPGLEAMMADAKVSNFFHLLYKNKTKRIQTYLTRLRRVPSKHNFFDCETVLELTHPESKQRVLLMQGDMDVVSDGSDGDRSPEYDNYIAESQHYQPFTSYGWRKQTNQPNPLLSRWQDKLAEATTANTKSTLRAQIADMKGRSFLIARKDPFVVIPTSFLGFQSRTPFGATMGDYVVVIYKDNAYPAILGDAGPTYKMGEASLRIAQTINPKASPYSRPVSTLGVTYVVFPQSRDPKAPPNLEYWHQRCAEFLGKIGGIGEGYALHQWEDLFKKEAEEAAATEKATATATEKAETPTVQ